jgi:hypothetical protein
VSRQIAQADIGGKQAKCEAIYRLYTTGMYGRRSVRTRPETGGSTKRHEVTRLEKIPVQAGIWKKKEGEICCAVV